MTTKIATAFALTLLLAGCSSSVDMVSADKVATFKPGSTNQAEIVAELGKATHTITEADGTKIDQYPYAGSSSGGSIVPGFLGGSSSPNSYGMVSFKYGPGGVLKSVDTGK